MTTIDLGTVAARGGTAPGDTIDVDGVPVKADAQGNFFVRVNGSSAIVLRGKAATGAVVRVNGNAIRADASGYFSLRSALDEGSNTSTSVLQPRELLQPSVLLSLLPHRTIPISRAPRTPIDNHLLLCYSN